MQCTYYIEWPSLNLGCGNGGRWAVEVAVGCGFATSSSKSSYERGRDR